MTYEDTQTRNYGGSGVGMGGGTVSLILENGPDCVHLEMFLFKT